MDGGERSTPYWECWMRSVDELVSSWVEESACGSEGYGVHHSPLPGCGDLAGIHQVTESRQLRWQMTERTLEIVEIGLLQNGLPLKSCGFRLFLGSEVFHSSGVSFVSKREGSIIETCLCVATANRVLVRVSFRFNEKDHSIFSNGQREIFQAKFCEEKGWSPVCVCRIDYDTVVFGCTNGALMVGNFWESADVGDDQAISYTESFLRDSSMLKRIWSTMTLGFGNAPCSVIDICFLESMGVICTVGVNSVVRLWDLQARACVSAFELERSQQSTLPTGLRCITRALPQSQMVVIYLKNIEAEAGNGNFHALYIAGQNEQNPYAISRDKTVEEPENIQGNLSDFCLTDKGCLWASYVDEVDPLHATDLERYDEVTWGRQKREQAIQDGSSSRGCSVVYTSLEMGGWKSCKMNEFGDSSVSFPESDSEKDWVISSLFRNCLFDSRSVFDAVVSFCDGHNLDLPSTKDWGRSSEIWNRPSSARMVQNLVAEVLDESKTEHFLGCLDQSWKRRNSVLALHISNGSPTPTLVKVGGVSRLSFVPNFLKKLGDCGSDLLDLAYTADCLAEQRSTPFFLEETIASGGNEEEFLKKSRVVTGRIRETTNLSSVLQSIKELPIHQREFSLGFDELRYTVSYARDIALGVLGCMWGDAHQSYPETLRMYLTLDLFHWALCQPYEVPPVEGGRRRTLKRQEDPMGFSSLSLNGFVQESEPFFYFEKLFTEGIEGGVKVTSPVYWSIFLGFPSVMRGEEDGFPHAAIWMFQQLEYDRQWGTLRSLILRILSLGEALSKTYFAEPILKYYLGLCHLHLGDPRRASVCFKDIIPDSPDIGGDFWKDQMGRFSELLVSIGTEAGEGMEVGEGEGERRWEVDADFVVPFFKEEMMDHSTRVVFYDVCCCVYYMKIAEYMKTLDLSSYICEFTHLAVRCLTEDEATIELANPLYLSRYKQLQRDGSGGGMQERGRVGLYVTLFENYMKLCDYSHALQAVVRMAGEEGGEGEIAKNCLRRLLVQLCDNKRLSVLCNRACAGGDATEAFLGGVNQAWLKENTEAILLEKAKLSDAMSPPDYYGALYAFYVSQNELRKAGSVMYLLGRRLAGEEALTKASLDRMVRSFGCALTCLSFLEDRRKTDFYFVANSVDSPDEGEFSDNQSVAKYGTILSQLRPRETLDHPLYVDPKHMRRLYCLVSAYRALLEREEKEKERESREGGRRRGMAKESIAISLASKLYEVLDSVSGLSNQARMCIDALLQQEMYPMAVEMINLFNVPMLSALFQSLAKQCVYSQIRTARFASFEGEAEHDGAYEYGGHLNPTDERWELLRCLLEHYDGSTSLSSALKETSKQREGAVSNYEYYCLVAETIYSIDRRLGLPLWLTKTLKENYPAALLKIYLKFFQLEEGCDLCVYLYKLGQSEAATTLLPHLFIDRFGSLLGRYTQDDQPEAIQAKGQELLARYRDARLNFYKVMKERSGNSAPIPSNLALGFAAPASKATGAIGFSSPAPKTTGASNGFSFGGGDSAKSSGFGSPAPKSSGGFASTAQSSGFGSPAPKSTETPSSGLSFGGADSAKSSGFGSATMSSGFGSPAPKSTETPSSGFSFGGANSSGFGSPAPKSAETPSSGLSFGGADSAKSSGFGSAATSSGFGSPAPKSTEAHSSGFSFGGVDSAKSSAFGSPAPKSTETPSSGLSFGGADSAKSSGFGSAATSSGFGSPAPKSTEAPSSGLSFGGADSAKSSGFGSAATSSGFGSATMSSGFGSPAPKSTETPSSGLSFGGADSAKSSGFGSAATSSGFGSPAPKSTETPSSGFSFGGVDSTKSSGFGSAATSSGFGAPAPKSTETPSSGFSFGSGGGDASSKSTFGTSSTKSDGASSGFSFGGGGFGGGDTSSKSTFGDSSAKKDGGASGGFTFGGGSGGLGGGGGDNFDSPFGKKDDSSSGATGFAFGAGGGGSSGFGGGSGGFGGGGFSFGGKTREKEGSDESEG